VNENEPSAPPSPRLLCVSAGVLYAALLLIGLVWSWLRTGRLLPEPLVGGRPWESLGWGLLLAAVVLLLTGASMRRIRMFRWFAQEVRGLIGPVSWGTAAALGLMSGIGEELFFRGAMQPALGYTLTSLIFGLVHVGPDRRYFAWTGFAVAMGFLFGGIQEWTGSLLGPLLAHVLINTVNLRRIGRIEPATD
jgi:membrane protease YdiL (CAAX protease family)